MVISIIVGGCCKDWFYTYVLSVSIKQVATLIDLWTTLESPGWHLGIAILFFLELKLRYLINKLVLIWIAMPLSWLTGYHVVRDSRALKARAIIMFFSKWDQN